MGNSVWSPELVFQDLNVEPVVQQARGLMARWHPEARRVTTDLLRYAPYGGSAQVLLRRYRQPTSSILSRYQRRALPSPKAQLAVFRQLLILEVAATARTAVETAAVLGYTSPQALIRHLHHQLGLTWREFVRRYTPERFWVRVVPQVVGWADDRWSQAAVLTGRGSLRWDDSKHEPTRNA